MDTASAAPEAATTLATMLKSMLSLTLALRSAALVPRVAQQPRRATIRMMSDEKVADFSKIDLRVGTIVSAWNHPDSDKLIVEEIDIGEDEPRQIVSGLRAFYEADALAGKKCVVVANLPKAKLGGVDSFGMVLCGSKDEKAVVEILEPPAEAEDGERAFVDGADGDAATANQVKKKKFWPPVAEKLAMAGGVATFDGQAISTSEGPCTCPSVADGMLS